MDDKQFTLRGFFIGFCGLIVITASSMYVALRMGALPWPTIFVTVVSFALLNLFKKKPTLQEVNVTHTMMSAGAMVAGGLAFTLPGIWIINPEIEFPIYQMIALSLAGAILGILFTILFRQNLIEKEKLVFPMGVASYNTLIAGDKGGKDAKVLFSSMGGSAVFTLFRDGFKKIPSVFTIFGPSAYTPTLSIWLSPMALGIGAIIGPVLAYVWLGGCIFANFIMQPVGIKLGWFASTEVAVVFKSNLGIGLLIGTGIAVALKIFYSKAKALINKDNNQKSQISNKKLLFVFICILLVVLGITFFTEITFLQAVVSVILISLVTYISGSLTGQTGINPMEIFGILVLLAVGLVWKPSLIASFTIASITAVACGLSGDVMNDLKSGYMLKTNVKAQISAEAIGGIIGAVLSVFILLAMKKAFGGFGTSALPAPQANAVAAMVNGLGNQKAFFLGVGIGILLHLLKVPTATLGLGVYLPVEISMIMGLGAVIVSIFSPKKKNNDKSLSLIASGLLGGEGITGVVIAILSIFVL
ncbi:MAG: OPT/YSL family transporter [Sphaerochaetaceae bacterium]